jgi:hypothetical protein
MHLEQELRALQVFMDTQTIEGGDQWERTVSKALKMAQVFLILIGPKWLGEGDGGSPRLADPKDWVHKEVRFARAIG